MRVTTLSAVQTMPSCHPDRCKAQRERTWERKWCTPARTAILPDYGTPTRLVCAEPRSSFWTGVIAWSIDGRSVRYIYGEGTAQATNWVQQRETKP